MNLNDSYFLRTHNSINITKNSWKLIVLRTKYFDLFNVHSINCISFCEESLKINISHEAILFSTF